MRDVSRSFEVLQNDIAQVETGIIVNPANPLPKIEMDKYHDVRRLAKEINPCDFIWMYVGGKYYLAQVTADSRYKYNADSEAIYYRDCNHLTNIDWKCVGTRKDVDEKTFKRLQRGMTLTRLFYHKNPKFTFGLQYMQEVFKKLS